MQSEGGDVDTIDEDSSRGGLDDAKQSDCEGRLPSPSPTHDPNLREEESERGKEGEGVLSTKLMKASTSSLHVFSW